MAKSTAQQSSTSSSGGSSIAVSLPLMQGATNSTATAAAVSVLPPVMPSPSSRWVSGSGGFSAATTHHPADPFPVRPQPPPSFCGTTSTSLASPPLASSSSGAAPTCCPPGEHCGGERCVHKEALASHIVDLTFDAHKAMLRRKLKEAQAELELLRRKASAHVESATQKSSALEEVASLRRELDEERRQSAALRAEISQLRVDHMITAQKLKVLERAPAASALSATAAAQPHLQPSTAELLRMQCSLWGALQLQSDIMAVQYEWYTAQWNTVLQHLPTATSREGAKRRESAGVNRSAMRDLPEKLQVLEPSGLRSFRSQQPPLLRQPNTSTNL